MSAGLTEAQARGLRWIRDNEPVSWWKTDSPNLGTRRKLFERGLIESIRSGDSLSGWRITEAGRSALAEVGHD